MSRTRRASLRALAKINLDLWVRHPGVTIGRTHPEPAGTAYRFATK
ncbi:MAG TPA: hypothetical protein VMG35_22285 [Bryobacteraceae bacterium]|nr:hypothetical protein [Bryobacteraceae bacterium]